MALLKFKRSAVPAKVPALNDLALGELAINTYDGKVYTKKDNGTASIVEVGGGGGVTSFNTRTGAVTLTGGDVTTALGYTPANKAGDTFNGVVSIYSSNDAQLYLNGNGTSWAGMSWADVSGSDYIWYNGSTSTFAIGGGGSYVANKKLHVHGGMTIGSGLAMSASGTNSLLVENEISATIFRDSQNSAYYIDPNSTSRMNTIQMGNVLNIGGVMGDGTVAGTNFHGIEFHSEGNRDYYIGKPAGGWTQPLNIHFYTGINHYAHQTFGGHRFWNLNDGQQLFSIGDGGNIVRCYGTLDVPIIYDINNSSYYVDPASGTVLNRLVSITGAGNTDGGNLQLGDKAEGTNKWSVMTGAHFNGVSQAKGVMLIGSYSNSTANQVSIGGNVYEANPATQIVFFTSPTATHATGGLSRLSIDGNGAVTASVDIRAPIFYDSNNTAFYANMDGTSEFNTIQTRGGSGFRSFATPAASINSQLYFADAGNTRAWNWQLDENNNAALWSYGGSSWGKRFGVTHDSELFLRNSSGSDVSLAYPSTFGYSSSYKTMVLGNQSLTTVCIGVSPASNPSGSFNGGGLGLEVMFRNGVNFITPNSANNGYLNVMQMTDGVANFTAYATAAGSFRAPIFYDSNNTAYYVDPNSGSRMNGITADNLESYGSLTVAGGAAYRSDWTTRFQSGSDFVNGTLVTTDIPATGFAGASFIIEITGKSYSATNLPFKVVAQGYLYNDTIINYTGISYGGDFATYIKVFEEGGVLKFWWPRISYWNSFNVNVMAMDGPTNNTITRNRVTAIGNSTEPTGTKKQQINLSRFMRGDVSATNSVDVRAPIFYDSNNTAFYADPDATTNLSTVYGNEFYSRGWFRNNNSNTGLYNQETAQHWWSDSGSYWNMGGGNINGQGIRFRDTHNGTVRGYVYYDQSNNVGFLNNEGNWRARVVGGDYFLADGSSARAQIFYDSNDTTYYIDPAGNGTRAGYLNGNLWINPKSESYGEGVTFYMPNQATWGGLRWYRNGSAGGYAGNWAVGYFGNETNNDIGFHNGTNGWRLDHSFNNTVNGSFRAPIFYDSNNTAYYVDPNEVSKTWRMGANYFQSNDDVSADTPFGLYFANGLSSAYAIFREGGAWSHPYPDLRIAFHTGIKMGAAAGYGGMKFYTDYDMSSQVMSINNGADGVGGGNVFVNNVLVAAGDIRSQIFYDYNNTGYYLDASSTGTSLNVAGSIIAAGNVTAYSDIRIKANVETIPSALEKIDLIRGVTYTRTDLDDKEQRYAGVIAQEIEAVLPEAVRDLGDIKAVDYNATIALLIEAVKELALKVKTLEEKDN